MPAEDWYGLKIEILDAAQALARRQPGYGDADLIRVREPDDPERIALAEAGFVIKPSRVTWLSPVLPSEAAFLSRLASVERQTVARSRRSLAQQGITIAESAVLTPDGLLEFLALYERQVSGMRYGVSFAARERDAMLAQRDDYVLISAYAGVELAGGCVCRVIRDKSTLHIRFSAVALWARQHSLVRPLYLSAVQVARELRLGAVSLGNDMTLYGHLVKPGLFRFKKRLGFTAVPAQQFMPGTGADEADLVPALTAFTDPALMLGYRSPGRVPDPAGPTGTLDLIAATLRDRPFELTVLSRDPAVDTRPYAADFVGRIRTRTMPPPDHPGGCTSAAAVPR